MRPGRALSSSSSSVSNLVQTSASQRAVQTGTQLPARTETGLPASQVSVEDEPGAMPVSGGLWLLAVAAAIAGSLTGLIGVLFQLTLEWADGARSMLLAFAHQFPQWGLLIPVVVAALCVGLARYLVRFAAYSAGSGVQHVEAVMRGESEPASPSVIPVKFVGGALAIGAGMALGREGPTVQIGSVVGSMLARWLRMEPADLRALQAAAAGAGLAVAFNAPTAGVAFVFEELARRISPRLTVATLIACGIAIAVARLLLGNRPVFTVGAIAAPAFWTLAIYLLFGTLLGAGGVVYNRAIITGLDLFERATWLPVEVRAAAIGGVVGAVGWFAPAVVGGGEAMNAQILAGKLSLATLALLCVARWFFGPFSYAAETPGGLFAPLLVVGALFGALFGGIVAPWFPGQIQPTAFAMVGMAAFYTAVVRSPLTGILLVVEMTANTVLLVPLLIACFGAMLVAELLRGMPIYDTLRLRMLQAEAHTAGAG